jgi:nitric oxide reductase NorD protein
MSNRKLFADELEAQLDELLFASPSHRSISRLAEGLEALPRVQQDQVLHWAGVAAQTYAEIGYLICTLSPKAFAFLDDAGYEAWVLAGLDAYDKQGLRPAIEQLRDLEGLKAAREGRSGVRFTDVDLRLSRFVQGLSGRPLGLRQADKGDAGWTDTETIFLPPRLARLTAAEDNRRLYKAMATLLWAQTRYGTFNVDIDAALSERVDREAALAWLTLFEAIRLEACIGRELPGLAREISNLRGPWPVELDAAVSVLSRSDASVVDSLRLLTELGSTVPPAPTFSHLGILDPAAAWRARGERIGREKEIVRKALDALRGAGGIGQQDPDAPLTVDDGPQSVEIEGDMVAMLPPDARAAAQSLIQDLGEIPPELLTPAGEGSWTPVPEDVEVSGVEFKSTRDPDRRYDEWDYHRLAYRRNWCHMYESEVEAGDAGYVGEVRTRHAPLIRQIRRRFEILRGEDRIHKRQPEGEEIDVDALVEAMADRRGGAEPSARLFCRRLRTDRSLAVMFMVDMSGSTKGWINDAERESLIMLCEALETLGDDYAIYGFSGWTRTRCDIYRIKRFGEAYSEEVRARIAGIEAKDYTRMGVAVRHLTGLLVAEPARHKLLITLSDGRPDDFGDEYRGTYGIEDTRRALQEARQKGIRSYCVTIDRHGADYLSRLYGPARYTVLDDVKKLPLRIAEIYRKLTT